MGRQDDPRQISIPGTEAKVPLKPRQPRNPQAPADALPLFQPPAPPCS